MQSPNLFGRLVKIIGSILLAGSSLVAHASTECQLTPVRFYVGEGHLWVVFDGGSVGLVQMASPDFKSLLSVVTAAVLTQRSIVARFAEDNMNCAGWPSANSLVGVWLSR
jgi:hypothetical protein